MKTAEDEECKEKTVCDISGFSQRIGRDPSALHRMKSFCRSLSFSELTTVVEVHQQILHSFYYFTDG